MSFLEYAIMAVVWQVLGPDKWYDACEHDIFES